MRITLVHRASLWSQLYGRVHFIHFGAYPSSWATARPIVLNIGRAILVLALIPTIALLLGTILKAGALLTLYTLDVLSLIVQLKFFRDLL